MRCLSISLTSSQKTLEVNKYKYTYGGATVIDKHFAWQCLIIEFVDMKEYLVKLQIKNLRLCIEYSTFGQIIRVSGLAGVHCSNNNPFFQMVSRLPFTS